jgi:ribonuclease-3
LEEARAVTLPLIKDRIHESARHKEGGDFKTRLQEWLQARKQGVPVYSLISAEGPDHQKSFTSEVVCNGQVLGRGRGKTKKAAEQEAARQALQDTDI